MKKPKAEKTALVQAVDLLARQEQSEKKLRDKLKIRGYGAEEIDAAIARLKERHYLDDEAACARQFQFLYEESRQSVRQICAKLMQRGFAGSIVRACVPKDIFARETRAALRCLQIRFRPSADDQKMMQSLYRYGFSTAVIRAAAAEFLSAAAENEDN